MSDYFASGSGRRRLLDYLIISFISSLLGALLATTGAGLLYGRALRQPLTQANPGAVEARENQGGENPVVQVVGQVTPAVVGITNKGTLYDWFNRPRVVERGSGSGVIFHPNGYIATNNHVVEGAQSIVVTLADGQSLPGKLVGRDPHSDLAVVKIEGNGYPVAFFGDSEAVRVGETAIAIGNPLGFEQTVTVGVISAINRTLQVDERRMRFLQTDAAINAGNSGGPLVNILGQVIGINTAKIPGVGIEGLSFAIPTSIAQPILNNLISAGRIAYPWMGVTLADRATLEEYGYEAPFSEGIFVVSTVRNGPAAKAGLREGDIILSIAGEKVNSIEELQGVIVKRQVGEQVPVLILRNERQLEVPVTLEEAPLQ